MNMNDFPHTGGVGFIDPEPVSVREAIDVLAEKYQFDPNGATAVHWITRLDDNDYFKDLSFEEKQEIARMVAQNNCVALRHLRQHMIDMLEEITEES